MSEAMTDLHEAKEEVSDYLSNNGSIKEPALLGLILVAREVGGQLDLIDTRLMHIADKFDETNRLLTIIAKALESLALAANRTLEP